MAHRTPSPARRRGWRPRRPRRHRRTRPDRRRRTRPDRHRRVRRVRARCRVPGSARRPRHRCRPRSAPNTAGFPGPPGPAAPTPQARSRPKTPAADTGDRDRRAAAGNHGPDRAGTGRARPSLRPDCDQGGRRDACHLAGAPARNRDAGRFPGVVVAPTRSSPAGHPLGWRPGAAPPGTGPALSWRAAHREPAAGSRPGRDRRAGHRTRRGPARRHTPRPGGAAAGQALR